MTAVTSKTALIVSSDEESGRARTCEPITVGIPIPRGVVTDARRIGLVDSDGKATPVQALPTELWPDGSIRWALLDFQASGAAGAERRYQLSVDAAATTLPAARVQVTDGR